MKSNTILVLSLPQAVLIIVASSLGLLSPGFYTKETPDWAAQSIGQDIIDLFLVTPALIITTLFAIRKSKAAMMLWGGINLYLVYTFLIYCFDVHFNKLFLVYCFTLGFSFYSFAYFLLSLAKEKITDWLDEKISSRFIGIYFLLIPLIFYFLWLSEVLPAILNNETPKSLRETGLFTNPVHVIDLSVFLPGLFLVGILLIKRKNIGLLLAPVILTFFIIMDITIGGLIVVMKMRGIESDYIITIVMSLLAVFSAILLIVYLRSLKKPS